MPACARKEIVRKGVPGIFHCVCRCVRRAWLLGLDPLTGKSHDERRGWVIERLQWLARHFAIDVGFSAVMSNHLHLVLRTHPRIAENWSDTEVARRWLSVYPGTWVLDGQWLEPTPEQIDELIKDKKRIRRLRGRLMNISWFMGAVNEYIARRANRQDNSSGHFWEARFKCRECTCEASLLICGMYVDLNQVRAGAALSPEQSEYCSVWWRIQAARDGGLETSSDHGERFRLDAWLAPLTLESHHLGDVPSSTPYRSSDKGLLDLSLEQYLELLDFAGRVEAPGKSGSIPAHLAPILERLGLREEHLKEAVENFESLFRRIAGKAQKLADRAAQVGRKYFHGIRAASRIFHEAECPPSPETG